MSHYDTGRAAFERWAALGDDGETPWGLCHAAALLIPVAEDAAAGTWTPDKAERDASSLLIEAIGHACRCLITHCAALAVAPSGVAPSLDDQTRAVVQRAADIIEENHGCQSRSDALREAAGELGMRLDD